MFMSWRLLSPLIASAEDNYCWTGLFGGAVVALEPDNPQKSPCRGLELAFNDMLLLAAVEYPVIFESGLILMGYSTALVPIQETEDNFILWHLEIADDHAQLKADRSNAPVGNQTTQKDVMSQLAPRLSLTLRSIPLPKCHVSYGGTHPL